MEITIKEYTVLIDEEDYDKIYPLNWAPRTNISGQIYFRSGKIVLHRYVTSCPAGKVVDHINGDTLDNRKINLRICTKLENQYNQKKHNKKNGTHSEYKGVTFRKDVTTKPWEAFIYKDYKSKRLGYFKTEKEAVEAYNTAALECYGEFAKLNKVE